MASGEFSIRVATRSPGTTPSAASALAIRLAVYVHLAGRELRPAHVEVLALRIPVHAAFDQGLQGQLIDIALPYRSGQRLLLMFTRQHDVGEGRAARQGVIPPAPGRELYRQAAELY